VAGSQEKLATADIQRFEGTSGDLYTTLFVDDVIGAGRGKAPTASRRLTEDPCLKAKDRQKQKGKRDPLLL